MNETKLLEAKVAECNARADMWRAITSGIQSLVAMMKETREAERDVAAGKRPR